MDRFVEKPLGGPMRELLRMCFYGAVEVITFIASGYVLAAAGRAIKTGPLPYGCMAIAAAMGVICAYLQLSKRNDQPLEWKHVVRCCMVLFALGVAAGVPSFPVGMDALLFGIFLVPEIRVSIGLMFGSYIIAFAVMYIGIFLYKHVHILPRRVRL